MFNKLKAKNSRIFEGRRCSMLVFDIVKKVKEDEIKRQAAAVQKANIESFKKAGKGLGSFDLSATKSKEGWVLVKLVGQVPSVESILMTRFTNMLAGFAIGKLAYSDSSNPDEGVQSSLLKTSMITIGSGVISLTMGNLVYDTYYGNDVGDIQVNIPVIKKNESASDFRKRVEKWKDTFDEEDRTDDLPPFLKQMIENFYRRIIDAINVNTAMSIMEGGITAYHGYKRSGSIWTAIGWALFGNVGVAVSQGYAKKEKK